ncbi:MAG: NAD(P)/FAD-dependent oxidoreductase [Gemmatimonadales bacterium]
MATRPHHVVIVGGGVGGLYAARALARAPVEITLVDRCNIHLFQPLLYQVATGGLSIGDIAAPLRALLKRQRNAQVILGEALEVDARSRRVVLRDGAVSYDSLILAAGVGNHYFGNDEWAASAPGLKTAEDVVEIRNRVLGAFEAAEREADPAKQAECLTFAVVGAGPTGVELSGALAELAHSTLRGEFRRFDPRSTRIVLLDGESEVLPSFPAPLPRHARHRLERLGVEVRTGVWVTGVDEQGVVLGTGDRHERIPSRTVLWAAGVRGSPLGESLARATGCELDRMGRVVVNRDLTAGDCAEIMVIGDLAHVQYRGQPIPCVATAALQQGRYVAKLIRDRLAGRTSRPFRYFDKGSLATIGRSAAVANFRGFKFWGLPAWLLWVVVHLFYLVDFENRLLVLIQWGNNYITRHRGSRVILRMSAGTEEPERGPGLS